MAKTSAGATVYPFTPIFNGPAPGANTNIQSGAADLDIVGVSGRTIRVTVALTVSSVLNLEATDGTTTHVWGLNASSALNAADVYVFDVPAYDGLTYNFQVESDGVIEFLMVETVRSGS